MNILDKIDQFRIGQTLAILICTRSSWRRLAEGELINPNWALLLRWQFGITVGKVTNKEPGLQLDGGLPAITHRLVILQLLVGSIFTSREGARCKGIMLLDYCGLYLSQNIHRPPDLFQQVAIETRLHWFLKEALVSKMMLPRSRKVQHRFH